MGTKEGKEGDLLEKTLTLCAAGKVTGWHTWPIGHGHRCTYAALKRPVLTATEPMAQSWSTGLVLNRY